MQLKPIKCNINVMEYVEAYSRNASFRKVAISVRETEKEILEDIHYPDKHTVEMSQEQYETIFEPLFEEIKELNKRIEELNNNK